MNDLPMKTLSGVTISPGITIAKAFVFTEDEDLYPFYCIKLSNISSEVDRFNKAIAEATQEIDALKEHYDPKNDSNAIDLLNMHIMMINDPDMSNYVSKELALQLINVEQILLQYMDKMIDKLSNSNNALMRERIADFIDVKQRLIGHLSNAFNKQSLTKLNMITEETVLIAKELLPITAMQLKKNQLKAMVLQEGGITGHTAIIARTMAIPSIFNVKNLLTHVKNGDKLIIDADQALIFLNPDEKTQEYYQQQLASQHEHRQDVSRLVMMPAQTLDGQLITLKSNAQKLDDVSNGIDLNCDGIGLFRSEFLYLLHSMKAPPTENQLFEDYKQALILAQGRPLTIRTLDVGGDKIAKTIYNKQESNPLLGLRALRLCLDQHELFKTQLRALYRASSFGQLQIMLPFVSTLDELQEVLAIINDVKAQLTQQHISFNANVALGIMIEIPSAALTSGDLAPYVDFFSIGTNDLTQYSLAVDRTNEKIRHLYQPLHPAVLKLMMMSLQAANDHRIDCSICGELAGDLDAIPLLVGMGFTALSMSPSRLPMAKSLIRKLNYTDAKALSNKILTLKNEKEIVDCLKQFKEEKLERIN